MKLKGFLFGLLFVFAALPAQALSLGLDFNDNSFEARFGVPVSQDDYGQAIINGRFLFNDDERTRLMSADISFIGEPGNVPGLQVGANVTGYYGSTHRDFDTSNIGIGVLAQYAPPSLLGFGLGGKFIYSPEIFSFLDSEGMTEGNIRLFYNITPKIQVYVGYQNIRGDFKRVNKLTLDDEFRLGIEAKF